MITRDGYAKILDFGLAKLTEQTRPPGVEGDAPTAVMRQPLSTPGVVMGTVGYMSPEQAQGRAVDHRSDIFSFGCLLYSTLRISFRMCTSERPPKKVLIITPTSSGGKSEPT